MFMKYHLLPETGTFYKANLHCHSTVSDGKWTPEEIKRNYMAQGYSIVAYTDHEVVIPHNDLRDENFLPITGAEISVNKNIPGLSYRYSKQYHLTILSTDPEKTDFFHFFFSVFLQLPACLSKRAHFCFCRITLSNIPSIRYTMIFPIVYVWIWR